MFEMYSMPIFFIFRFMENANHQITTGSGAHQSVHIGSKV